MHEKLAGRKPYKVIRLVAMPLFVGLVAAFVLASGVTAAPTGTAAPAAKAKDPLVSTLPAVVHGVAADGTEFNGTFTLKRFDARDGVLYAIGRLEGQLGERNVHKNVRLPVNGAVSDPIPASKVNGTSGVAQPPVPTPGSCPILTLDLGPLDLDLLGLRVALSQINLLIEAIPGAGNLLGNLLCAVAGLLDPGPVGLPGLIQGLLDAIANLLNGLLGGL
jgi:hypothetical protein